MPQAAIAETLAPNLPAIAQRIANGEYATHIADELGISKQILSYHLRQLPDWSSVLETAHEARLDETDKALNEAVGARDFDLARARAEQLKRREWRAEREAPHRWGPKQEVRTVAVQYVVEVPAASAWDAPRTIEAAAQETGSAKAHECAQLAVMSNGVIHNSAAQESGSDATSDADQADDRIG